MLEKVVVKVRGTSFKEGAGYGEHRDGEDHGLGGNTGILSIMGCDHVSFFFFF